MKFPGFLRPTHPCQDHTPRSQKRTSCPQQIILPPSWGIYKLKKHTKNNILIILKLQECFSTNTQRSLYPWISILCKSYVYTLFTVHVYVLVVGNLVISDSNINVIQFICVNAEMLFYVKFFR